MKKNNLFTLLAGLLIPLAVLILYYASHKPFTPEIIIQLALLIWRLAAAWLIVLGAGGLGYKLAPLESLHPLARLALQAALGFGGMGLVVMLTGTTLGLPRWLFWAAVPAFLWVFRRSIRLWVRQFRALKLIFTESGRFGRFIAGLIGLQFLATLTVALAPPLKYDALIYHLTLPAAYLQAGRMNDLPWIVMSGHPQTAEMLYTWAMALGGASSATALSWCISLLAGLGLLGYLRQRLNLSAAWAGCAALFAGYSLSAAAAWGYVDWLTLLFGLGCLISMEEWRLRGERVPLLLSGAFAGMALATKYTAGVLGLVAGLALIWHIGKRKAPFFSTMLQFAGAAALIAVPWLIKNWILTGNPLYPFFFPSGAMDALRITVYQGLPPYGNWLDFFLLPFRATYLGLEGGEGYSVSAGPLLLGFGLLAWANRRERSATQNITLENTVLFGLLGLFTWAVGNQFSGYLIQTRMYFPIFPAFAALAAFGFWGTSRLQVSQIRLGRILGAMVLLVLGLNTFEVGWNTLQSRAPQAALGMQAETDYLPDNLGWYAPAMQALKEMPDGSKTLLIYEPRSFYCLPACAPDEILDRWVREYSQNPDTYKIEERWLQEGFTHILVNRSGVEFLKTDNDPHHPLAALTALDEFLETLQKEADFGGVYELYKLEGRN